MSEQTQPIEKPISSLGDETLLEINNKVFRMSIPLYLYRMRNAFCPHDGKIRPSWTCPSECPIFKTFYYAGLSCNEALDRHPNECIALMRGAGSP